jgi:hypothetical protein
MRDVRGPPELSALLSAPVSPNMAGHAWRVVPDRVACDAQMGAETILAPKLPPSFTSLYRLFLRASSASVLHHRTATRHVQTLWKPTFREAAVVSLKLQSPTLGTSEKERLEKWRFRWELSSELSRRLLRKQKEFDFCSGQDPFVACYFSSVARSRT